jgi:hypothetical protein
MNGTQYEEFCRLFLKNKYGIPIEAIHSCRIPSPTHPDLSEYENQIDLYWEDGNELTLYRNIADAKWRGGSDKVPIGRVRELQQVKEDIDVHKAIMITNTDFTSGARAFAENKGIALHIVRPNFDFTILHPKNREIIQTQLQEPFTGNKPPYTHEVVYRAFDLGIDVVGQSSDSGSTVTDSKAKVPTYSNRMAQPRSYTQKRQGRRSDPPTGGRGGSGKKVPGSSRRGGRLSRKR